MQATNVLILILCLAAMLGWCVFGWVTHGAGAWRRPLAGAFVIGVAGAVASSMLAHRPLIETLVLAIILGASAAGLAGAIQFSVWVREKGRERRDGEAGG